MPLQVGSTILELCEGDCNLGTGRNLGRVKSYTCEEHIPDTTAKEEFRCFQLLLESVDDESELEELELAQALSCLWQAGLLRLLPQCERRPELRGHYCIFGFRMNNFLTKQDSKPNSRLRLGTPPPGQVAAGQYPKRCGLCRSTLGATRQAQGFLQCAIVSCMPTGRAL